MNAYRGGPATLQRVGIRRIPAIVQSKPVPPILLQSQRRRAAFAAATGTCQCLRSLPARRPSSPVDGVSARGASADVDWLALRGTSRHLWAGRGMGGGRGRAPRARARRCPRYVPTPWLDWHPGPPQPARQAADCNEVGSRSGNMHAVLLAEPQRAVRADRSLLADYLVSAIAPTKRHEASFVSMTTTKTTAKCCRTCG